MVGTAVPTAAAATAGAVIGAADLTGARDVIEAAVRSAAGDAIQAAFDAAETAVAAAIRDLAEAALLDAPARWDDDEAVRALVVIGLACRLGLDPSLWVIHAREQPLWRSPRPGVVWAQRPAARWADIAKILGISTQAAAQRRWWRRRVTEYRNTKLAARPTIHYEPSRHAVPAPNEIDVVAAALRRVLEPEHGRIATRPT